MKIILTLGLWAMGGWLMACDVCSMYQSITPQDNQHSVGLRYRSRSMSGTYLYSLPAAGPKHIDHLQLQQSADVKEIYNVLELRVRVQLKPRIVVGAIMPYHNHYRSIDGITSADVFGLGDPTLFAQYLLLGSSPDGDESTAVHRLTVGGGMKLPLGRTDLSYDEEVVDLDMQPGTGSLDGQLSAQYRFLKKAWFGGASLGYRRNGQAKDFDYQYGESLSLNLEWHLIISAGSLKLAPKLGGYGEWMAPDREQSELSDNTGGSVVYATCGAKLWRNRWFLEVDYQKPLAQQYAGQQLTQVDRLIVGLNYAFNL